MAKSLPEELLLQILSQPSISPRIESDEDEEPIPEQYTLYNASLVSKSFHRLAQPLLYECIDARWRGGLRLLGLVQTLARRPEIAQNVRELRLGHFSCDTDDHRSRIKTEWKAFAQNAAKLSQRAHLSQELVKHFQAALATPSDVGDVGLAVFMVICSNLRAWEFHVNETYPLTEQVFLDAGTLSTGRHASAPTYFQPLQKLRELTISYPRDEGSAVFAEVRRYIAVPSLKTLRCTQFRLDDDLGGLSCGAQRVELYYADVEGDRVHELFGVFPKVSDLRLRWGDVQVCDAEINFAEIGARLRASGCNLKTLYLNAEESFWTDGDSRIHLPPLGSLRELEHLTELSLQAIMLTGRGEYPDDREPIQGKSLIAVLPFSLHVLEFNSFNVWGYDERGVSYTDVEGWFDEQIIELLGDQRYGKLHTIRMIDKKRSADVLLANASRLGWVARSGINAGPLDMRPSIDWEGPQEWIELRRLSPY